MTIYWFLTKSSRSYYAAFAKDQEKTSSEMVGTRVIDSRTLVSNMLMDLTVATK